MVLLNKIMATHFHSLKIKELKKETADCVSIYFDVPQNLSSEFIYKEGQNITIRKMINGEDVRRSYSICSAPHENKLKVAIKKVEGGLFSSFANKTLKQNDVLEVMSPTGRFNAHLSKNESPKYLAIAAGSGITPIIAIIKHTLQTQSNSSFTLIYGSKNRSAIIFFEELEDLKNKYMERFTLINVLSREKIDAEIFHGRINKIKLTALEKLINYKKTDAAYLCGPEEMIFSSSEFLQEQGLDKNKIHFELFTTPGQSSNETKTPKTEAVSSGPKSNITIRLDGRSFSFDLAYNGESILDAALQNGADLPYACKGGVCCTCRAKLIEGEVKMDVNYALEEEEVQQGFVLTCQSHPTTEKVFIDFDQK
jgi:ring-1,2-phenylacetyl-CoA epoxidase subunit PaaE